MRKTTIELTDEQYIYLLEKVLEFKRQNKSASMGGLIRDLVEEDMKLHKTKEESS